MHGKVTDQAVETNSKHLAPDTFLSACVRTYRQRDHRRRNKPKGFDLTQCYRQIGATVHIRTQ